MSTACGRYLATLVDAFGVGWNRFWFTPGGAAQLALLRPLVGLLTLIWLGSFSFELTALFSTTGLLPLDAVHQVMTSGDPTTSVPGFSFFFLVDSDQGLWAVHIASLAVVLLMTLGVYPRYTTPLSLVVVLSYIHRGPVLTELFEPVMCMLLLYLSLAPGVTLMGLWRGKQSDQACWSANVATRLMQLHICGFYLLMGLSMLGSPIWWTGDAAWYLISDAQHRLIDLSGLTSQGYLLDALTHAWVLFDLAFVILIWRPLTRPLMIAISLVVWGWTALVTGYVGFSAIMVVANLAFVPAGDVARWLRVDHYGSCQQARSPATSRT